MNYVYVVYDYYDNGPECISIHETPESVVQGLRDAGCGKIAKVWFGKPFKEEIAKWEGRELITPEPVIERQATHMIYQNGKTPCGLDPRLIDGLTVSDTLAGTTCEACKKALEIPS